LPKPHLAAKQRFSEDIMNDQASQDTPLQRFGSQGIDPKLLELLVCPVSKGPLDYDAVRQELVSASAKLAYPIRDGIPIMLPDEARTL
jgi:uncharacterized protein